MRVISNLSLSDAVLIEGWGDLPPGDRPPTRWERIQAASKVSLAHFEEHEAYHDPEAPDHLIGESYEEHELFWDSFPWD
jgi:hypothetical protein